MPAAALLAGQDDPVELAGRGAWVLVRSSW